MNTFKILDHPADIGIEIYGKFVQDIFINAALGTTSLLVDLDLISANTNKEINLKGSSYEKLLTIWLDEIIFLFDSEGFLVKNIETINIDNTSLKAIIKGEKFNSNNHKMKLYLKAVTHHQLEIKQLQDKSWRAKVYFDV